MCLRHNFSSEAVGVTLASEGLCVLLVHATVLCVNDVIITVTAVELWMLRPWNGR